MTAIILILSFLLDGLLSIYKETSLLEIVYLRPMFTIASLTLIYLWYTKSHHDYYRICIIMGLAYDLIYTNTIPLNTLIFLLLGYIIQELYIFFKDNLINGLVIDIIILTLDHLLTFTILFLIGYLPFNTIILSYDLLSILITNTIFYTIMYTLLRSKIKKSLYSI